jgi:transmembrane sensor
MDEQRIIYLVNAYGEGKLRAAEEEELLALTEEAPDQVRAVIGAMREQAALQPIMVPREQLRSRIDEVVSIDRAFPGTSTAPLQRIHLLRMPWFKYAAAIIIFFGLGTYLYFNNSSNHPSEQLVHQALSATDVQPGGNKATLTLADGRTIVLDSAANGELAREGFSKINKTSNGAIEYITDRPGANMTEASSAMNMMRTPKGGEYQLVLPDGSRAWLNANSSITYPAVFVGSERKVEVTGEVYFEIAKKSRQPFRVTVNGAEVQVLGTKFNVNAYGDETRLSTTLLEGSVLVKNGIALEKLQPGQQAQISRAGELEVMPKVNTDAVMAWRNGTISFDNHSLETNLKQLARWYDVTVAFEGPKPEVHLAGTVDKSLTLAQVLKGLEGLKLHTRLDPGNKLVVLP